MNTIPLRLPTDLTATARARANGIQFDYFSIPRLCVELCELLSHAKTNADAIRRHLRDAKAYQKREDYSRANTLRKLASDDRTHFLSIADRANELPIVREGDSARRKQILAICKRGRAE
jgi:hypothetical protein